jgi:hypothetical protein
VSSFRIAVLLCAAGILFAGAPDSDASSKVYRKKPGSFKPCFESTEIIRPQFERPSFDRKEIEKPKFERSGREKPRFEAHTIERASFEKAQFEKSEFMMCQFENQPTPKVAVDNKINLVMRRPLSPLQLYTRQKIASMKSSSRKPVSNFYLSAPSRMLRVP